jgi:hypothetical protein
MDTTDGQDARRREPPPEPALTPGVDEVRDELPGDLIAAGYVGPYQFPDNSRRRVPGILYLVLAVIAVLLWWVADGSSPLVNGGLAIAALGLGAFGLFSISSGWRMRVDETDALQAAQQALGFPIGHASAQQVWRGLRSRPTWRVLCYSADEPPSQRGLVLVDAVDGTVVEYFDEPNPESWARPGE